MIQARRSNTAERVFEVYIRSLFRRHFHALTLLGTIPDVRSDLPILLLPNHSTWWDGFFVFALNRELFRRPLYVMMLEKQLLKYRFFTRLGAYSVRPGSPRSVAETLRYTLSVLGTQPAPLVCIFPQGELLPPAIRPLGFQRGVEHIIARTTTPVTVVPLAIHCEFLGEQRPEAFFQCGMPFVCDAASTPSTESLEAAHHTLLDDLRRRITTGRSGRVLFKGGRSINTLVDSLRRR